MYTLLLPQATFYDNTSLGLDDPIQLDYPIQGFSGGLHGKESVCNAEDPGLIPGLGRSLGEGNGNLLHYSCLENSTDRGAWWATVHGIAKSQT